MDDWGASRAVMAILLVAAALLCSFAWAPAALASPPWTGLVSNNQHPSDNLGTFDPVGETVGQSIGVGGDNTWVEPSPDGSAAYVETVFPSAALKVVDLASRAVTSSVSLPNGNMVFGALSPDGKLVYLSGGGQVQPVNVSSAQPTLGAPITVPNSALVAFSPDGRTAWVTAGTGGATTTGVVPIDVATGSVGTLIPTGAGALGVTVSPDGTTVWVANHDAQSVSEIDAVTKTVIHSIPVTAGHPLYLTPSPDGSRVWVSLQAEHELTWINTSDGSVGTALNTGGVEARGLAVTPDGKKVFVTDGTFNGSGQGSQVTPVDATTSTPTVKPTMTGFVDPVWAAITPDQAPVANFTVQSGPPGSPSSFDASSSLAPSTPIVSYAWNFGDGTTQTTSTPTVSHTYASAGVYQASVTETDSAGTSTTPVYTGQQLARNGGPGATATRSVVVTTGGAPQARLSSSALDFGTIGLPSRSGAQTVTLTNGGDAPLVIQRASIAGANAGDFRLSGDTCSGATLAAGSSCTATVDFAPTAGGPRSAQLVFIDNASGSPHTVSLTGAGTTFASVAGTIRGEVGGATAALPGATVSICLQRTRSCSSTTTGMDGGYRFTGLAASNWTIEVYPPLAQRSLFPASALVSLAPATSQTQDFLLSPPAPLSNGIALDGITTGTPATFCGAPFTLSAPAGIADHEPAGIIDNYTLTFGVGPYSGSSDPNAQALAHLGVQLTVRYDASGRPVLTAVRDVAETDKAGTEPMFQGVAQLDPQPAKLPADASSLQRITVIIDTHCQFHGTMQLSINRVHKFAHTATKARGLSAHAAADPDPGAEPCDSLDSCGVDCPPATAPEDDGPGCDGDDDVRTPNDPSGNVLTRQGFPLAGAKVVLERSAGPSGPFRPLRDHSAYLASWTPHNPERSTQLGHFAWDVFSGFYRVKASRSGCKPGITRAYRVPPPVLGIKLKLTCPGLTRAPTRTRLRSRRLVGGRVLITATVQALAAKHQRPAGEITFTGRGRTIGAAEISARTRSARIEIPAKRARGLRAKYSGDAYFKPSRSR